MCAELWNIYCLYTTSYNLQMDSMCYPQMNNAEMDEQLRRLIIILGLSSSFNSKKYI